MVASDKRFLLFSRLSDNIRKTFRFLRARQHNTRLYKYQQKKASVKLSEPVGQDSQARAQANYKSGTQINTKDEGSKDKKIQSVENETV